MIFAGAGRLLLYGSGTQVDHLYVRSPGNANTATFALVNSGVANDLIAVATAASKASACFARSATIASSLCWARGAGSTALAAEEFQAGSVESLRNVTAIAPGAGSVGVVVRASDGGGADMTVANSIVRGGSGGYDLRVESTAGSAAAIHTSHSNYSSHAAFGPGATDPTPDATDQSAKPSFVDAAHGDFHQRCGSITIDNGVANPFNGARDFDGQPRTVGGAPDIGVDELAAGPTAVTGRGLRRPGGAVALRGTLNARGCASLYQFDFGRTKAYTRHTPLKVLPVGSAPVPVTAPVGGLVKNAIYHFRLSASSDTGSAFGADRLFSTYSGARASSKPVTAGAERVRIVVACPKGIGSCAGAIVLKAKSKGKTVTVGRGKFNSPAGGRPNVPVKLSEKGRALLDQGSVQARAIVTSHDSVGTVARTSRRVTLKSASG